MSKPKQNKVRFGGFNRTRKKTRQGCSNNTKLKIGQKKYRGQGK